MTKFNYKQERENAKKNRGKKLLRALNPCLGHVRIANNHHTDANRAVRVERYLTVLACTFLADATSVTVNNRAVHA